MHRRTFQIAFYVLGTYTALLTIATTAVFILRCLPISFFWYRAYLLEDITPPHPVKGHCLPQRSSVVTTLIANTVTDVALLVLPAIGIWNLKLPSGKKVGLFGVFSLGALYANTHPIFLTHYNCTSLLTSIKRSLCGSDTYLFWVQSDRHR